MDKINKFLHSNSKYTRLSGPLQAAHVCDTARALAADRFSVLTYVDGLLTLGVSNSMASANLRMELTQIMAQINEKLGVERVKKIRLKIV